MIDRIWYERRRRYFVENPDERYDAMYRAAIADVPVADCPAVITEEERASYLKLLEEIAEIRSTGMQVEDLITRLD
jgi:hypothetical protein